MDDFIAGLCSTLTSGSFWSIVGTVVPIVAISMLFSLGYNLLRDIIQGYNYLQQRKKEEEADEWYKSRKKNWYYND